MSNGPPIPEIQHFQSLTLKIQGQGHSSRSQSRDNTLSTPFRSMSIAGHFLGIQLFQNLTLKIQGQGHKWGQSWKSQRGSEIQSTHIHFVPRESGILSCDFFKIRPWKSRAMVMRQVTLRSHNVSLRSYRLTSLSFHVNRASHSWVTTLSKFDLENQVSRSWVRSHFKVTMWVQYPIDLHPFCPCQSGIPFLSYDFYKIWPWKSRVKVMGEVTLQSHNVGLTSYRLTSLLFHVNRASHS